MIRCGYIDKSDKKWICGHPLTAGLECKFLRKEGFCHKKEGVKKGGMPDD